MRFITGTNGIPIGTLMLKNILLRISFRGEYNEIFFK